MRRVLFTLLALCLVAACSGDDGDTTAEVDEPPGSSSTDPTGSESEPQPCPVDPGDTIPANYHEVGCVDTQRNDSIHMGSYFDCVGGRRLFSDDVGYGFLGEPLNAPDNEGLRQAMDECDP